MESFIIYVVKASSVRLAVVVFDLGCEVITDVADVSDLVFDDQRNFRWHGQRDGRSQTRGLGEHVQVAAGERQGNGFLQFPGKRDVVKKIVLAPKDGYVKYKRKFDQTIKL